MIDSLAETIFYFFVKMIKFPLEYFVNKNTKLQPQNKWWNARWNKAGDKPVWFHTLRFKNSGYSTELIIIIFILLDWACTVSGHASLTIVEISIGNYLLSSSANLCAFWYILGVTLEAHQIISLLCVHWTDNSCWNLIWHVNLLSSSVYQWLLWFWIAEHSSTISSMWLQLSWCTCRYC